MKLSIIPFLFSFTLIACMGETTTKEEKISPDKKHVAIAQVYDGGATTTWAPKVYIRHNPNYKKWWYSESEEEKVFSGYGSEEISIKWETKDTLVIYCKCKQEFLVNNYWGIKVVHKYKTPNKQVKIVR